MVRYWVGVDVGKAFHWVCILDDGGEVVLSRRVEADERDIEGCCEEIAAFGSSDERKVATDLLGGPATLLEAVLAPPAITSSRRCRHAPNQIKG